MKIRIKDNDKTKQKQHLLMFMVSCNLIISLLVACEVYKPQIHGVLKWLQISP